MPCKHEVKGICVKLSGDSLQPCIEGPCPMEESRLFDLTKPLMAEIYDFFRESFEDGTNSIIRCVDSIEFPNKRHNNMIIWYSDGFKSESYRFLPQEATP